MNTTVRNTITAFAVFAAGIIVVALATNRQSGVGTSVIASPEPDEIATWETFGIPEWNFEVRYPSTELVVSCPTYPACYLGSATLDGGRYYSVDEIPESSLRIAINSFGSEDSTKVTDLTRWLKSQPEIFDENAEYGAISIGDGYRGLRELDRDHETIYVATGTGRVLSFEVAPNTKENRELLEKVVSTISAQTF